MSSVGFPEKSDFRVVVVPPMGYAYTAFIKGDYQSMQSVVGGLVECIRTGIGVPDSDDREIDFWCNEEFLYAEDMVFNRVLTYSNGYNQSIFGPMFVAAATYADGVSHGLTFGEALSVLENERVCLPQLVQSFDDGSMMVHMITDGAGSALVDKLRSLSDRGKQANALPLDSDEIARLIPAPLVGKPEDLLVGKWRVHMVWPGESLAGGTESYFHDAAEADSVGLGQPIVEFWDMSQNRDRFPKGQFVSSYYLSDMRLDDGRSGIDLAGGVPSWTIEGGDFAVARQFVKQTEKAFEGEQARRATIERKFPWEQARDASRVSQESETSAARDARQKR